MSQEAMYATVRDDFFSRPLHPPEKVSLIGSRCRNCGEVFLGKAIACQNCQGDKLDSIKLSRTGKLWTYSVVRHRPPGNYKGPEPFEPFAVGLIELPEGVRVLSPLVGMDFDKLRAGMAMELVVEKLYQNEEGKTVLSFKFKPAGEGSR